MSQEYSVHLRSFLENIDRELMASVRGLLEPFVADVTADFYKEMMHHPESSHFLNNEQVQSRLTNSMIEWVFKLLSIDLDGDIDAYLKRQEEVGNRHARINIPLFIINIGTSVLKKHLFQKLLESDIERAKLGAGIILLNELIDQSMAAMNRVYFSDLMIDVRDQQALRLQSLGVDMALQTEGLRSSLFDWHRQVLGLLMLSNMQPKRIPAISKTDFGLWVFHKGDLLFQDSEEVDRLKITVRNIDTAFEHALELHNKGGVDELQESLLRIDEQVTIATTVLATMSEKTLAMEGGRDPLTKLFNRRFLRTILQREVKASINTNERFAVIIIDLDHFKLINDEHGHDAGDMVLEQFAEVLSHSVRAGDFVFRYGGEEFLVVLNAITFEIAAMVGEKIRATVENHVFYVHENKTLSMTISAGIAVHDGHPDYSNLITQSDTAAYKAKNDGRNQVQMFREDIEAISN